MNTRRTKLTSIGDELAIVLDPETLDAVGYTADTEVELRVEEGRLVIEPVRAKPREPRHPPAGEPAP
jgi:antitoxin component of MazEF toxin-antitoxin module